MFGDLFDFSLRRHVTPTLLRWGYAAWCVACSLWGAGFLAYGILVFIAPNRRADDLIDVAFGLGVPRWGYGALLIAFAVLGFLAAMMVGRIIIECIGVFFRIADDLEAMRRAADPAGSTRASR